MGRNVVSAKLDIIFKKIFGENEDILRDFLSKVLDIPAESIGAITIKSQELPPDTLSGKFSRLDLTMEFCGKLINIEIQIKTDPFYKERTLFYWAKLYTSSLKSGEEYGELKQTIIINIINFNMFDGNDFHTEIVAVEKGTDKIFSDKFSLHFFELKKISKKIDPNNGKELWLQFINAESEEEFEMINQTNIPIMQKAVGLIYDMSEDTKIQQIAWQREKALHDEATALYGAREEGRAEGIAEGRAKGVAEGRAKGMAEGKAKGIAEGRAKGKAEGIAEVIEKLKAAGMSEEQIQKILQ